ncbi:MAG: class I SAM-dependent methyltransferase [Planctomycetaceae bacterium]|jgi:SAM-dependent methyltransferase|nr:class I SAM-dependent methyltransferase [Planctomycetaceae bacterium]
MYNSQNIYNQEDSRYKLFNPSWHEEESPYKAEQIMRLIRKIPLYQNFQLTKIAEVGCGAGEILNQLHIKLSGVFFDGFDIAPDAIEMCCNKKTDRLSFYCTDFLETTDYYEIILLIDVFEHIDNCFDFLRCIRNRGQYFIFNIPLVINVFDILRNFPSLNYKRLGHKHFFQKETALYTLKDCGYNILTWHYGLAFGLPAKRFYNRLTTLPKSLLYLILNTDFYVRLFGGSLFVLATPSAAE